MNNATLIWIKSCLINIMMKLKLLYFKIILYMLSFFIIILSNNKLINYKKKYTNEIKNLKLKKDRKITDDIYPLF